MSSRCPYCKGRVYEIDVSSGGTGGAETIIFSCSVCNREFERIRSSWKLIEHEQSDCYLDCFNFIETNTVAKTYAELNLE